MSAAASQAFEPSLLALLTRNFAWSWCSHSDIDEREGTAEENRNKKERDETTHELGERLLRLYHISAKRATGRSEKTKTK